MSVTRGNTFAERDEASYETQGITKAVSVINTNWRNQDLNKRLGQSNMDINSLRMFLSENNGTYQQYLKEYTMDHKNNPRQYRANAYEYAAIHTYYHDQYTGDAFGGSRKQKKQRKSKKGGRKSKKSRNTKRRR